MVDCLLIGYNDGDFNQLVEMLRSMGSDHPDFRDLNTSFIEYNGKSYRALDILDYFYHENCPKDAKPFHNADLLWNGIMYLATFLSKRGLTFDYVNLFQFEKSKLKEKLVKNNIRSIAITTTIYTMADPVMEVISFVKQHNTTAKIIVGGPLIEKQAGSMDDEKRQMFFSYIGADFFILDREGEQALANVVTALKEERDFSEIRNIAYRQDATYRMTPIEYENNSLEENRIDYSLFTKEEIGESINVRISKGCPYSCTYCGFPLRSKKYRYLGTEYIIDELDDIDKFGTVKNLFFMDDSVNIPKARFKDLMRCMAERNYGFRWNCFLRCDSCDEETIELMQQAKCEGVFLGLESANEQLLKNMNKTSRKEHFLKTVPLFKKAGMVVFVSIFTGFPGETYETFQETLDFLKEIEPDFYRPQLWYCDPVTPIWEQRDKFGLKGTNFAWSHNTMDAKTACDLNDKAFLSLDTPVWVPDPGFNFISVFYLMHRGMSIEKQKLFLQCFNAIIKDKILFPNRREIPKGLLEALRKSCRFDRPEEMDLRPVKLYSGAEYDKTEIFLLREFYGKKEEAGSLRFKYFSLPQEERKEKRISKVLEIEINIIEKLKSAFGDQWKKALLTAFLITFNQISGKKELAFICGICQENLMPLKLGLDGEVSALELTDLVGWKIDKMLDYQTYALHILVNSMEYSHRELKFDFAYIFSDSETDGDPLSKYHNRFYNDLDFVLSVNGLEDGVNATICYSRNIYSPDVIQKYLEGLKVVVKELVEDAQKPLSQMCLGLQNSKVQLIDQYASKEFNF